MRTLNLHIANLNQVNLGLSSWSQVADKNELGYTPCAMDSRFTQEHRYTKRIRGSEEII